jgi:hypothetical protein
MQRESFLIAIGAIGVIVGTIALVAPRVLLTGKGITSESAAEVWMRQTGALIVAASLVVLLVRDAPDSATLRAIFWGNAFLHAAMFPIEILAWRRGTITRLSGIVPNSILHLTACAGFVVYAWA